MLDARDAKKLESLIRENGFPAILDQLKYHAFKRIDGDSQQQHLWSAVYLIMSEAIKRVVNNFEAHYQQQRSPGIPSPYDGQPYDNTDG